MALCAQKWCFRPAVAAVVFLEHAQRECRAHAGTVPAASCPSCEHPLTLVLWDDPAQAPGRDVLDRPSDLGDAA